MKTGSARPWGVYVHVPWCRHRCPYCAFHVDTDAEPPWERFVDRVLEDYAARREPFGEAPDTVFLGGGTPSRMPPGPLARLLAGLAPAPGAEITAEANPEDVSPAWLEGALRAGVNRLSLGVQSFDPKVARRLGRGHTAPQAREVAGRVAASGIASWSLDLIFAVPGQPLEDLHSDLDAILATGAPHVSLYGLTLEPGTPLQRLAERGTLRPVDDEVWRAMYEAIVARLQAAGLARYEVSNFARPGHESAHNRLYWTDRPYLGIGPSAHGYAPDGTRWVDLADTAAWLDGAPPAVEHPSPEEAATDLLVSALRGRDGVDLDHLHARTGHFLSASALAPLLAEGLLVARGRRIALGSPGYPVADAVIRHLVRRLAKGAAPD